MTIVEIRIVAGSEADAIGAEGAGAWVVRARPARQEAPTDGFKSPVMRSVGMPLTCAGWHARFAGATPRA